MLAYVSVYDSSVLAPQKGRKVSSQTIVVLSMKSLPWNPSQRRPLPTQSGEGSSLDHAQPSGLMSDIKAMGFKDVHTLIDVMKNKASGDLQDDKTYLMEHTIQVSRRVSKARCVAHRVLACQRLAHKVKNPSRFDQRFHRRAMELLAAPTYVLSRRQVCLPTG